MTARAMIDRWLRDGRASLDAGGKVRLEARAQRPPIERLRRAYDWIVDHAIITPYQDIELGATRQLLYGPRQITLSDGPTYASFVLLPLLNLATHQRLLIVGAPGRGKTSIALLMGMLAGHTPDEIRRSVQRGHPQLTITDLLGSPLPRDMVHADTPEQIRVAWRRWLTMRVKIIDEYNRIPTKTQSALLSLMAEGYAEMFEQTVDAARSAWFMTANDDLGGGTFPVIQALKDRIDAVVRATPYNARQLETLLERVRSARRPEEFIPKDLLLSPEDLDTLEREIRTVPVPEAVLELLGFFAGQLDFCTRASERLEYKTKDTLHLAGRRVAHVCNQDCPLDKMQNLCTQTENGISARSYQAILLYAKAFAHFRGNDAVGADDLRQLLPWVLHDKLEPNPHSPFFQKAEHEHLLLDRVSWIQSLFDRAIAQHAEYRPIRTRLTVLQQELTDGPQNDLDGFIRQIEGFIEELLRTDLPGPVYEDLLLLKHLHARCLARQTEQDADHAS